MKIKLSILALCQLLTLLCFGQDPNRKNSFGVYQSFTDYNVELLNDKVFAFDSALSQSTRLAYQRLMSPSWVLNTGISNGFIVNQSLKQEFIDKAYAVGADVGVMFKFNNGRFMKVNPRIAPYLSFAYKTDYVNRLNDFDKSPWIMSSQPGAGLTLKITERTHAQIQANIDQKLMGDFNTHMQYRMGITQSLGKYSEDKSILNKEVDSDGDGIVDARDNCPGRFGLKSSNGCPDTLDHFAQKILADSLKQKLAVKNLEMHRMELELAELRSGAPAKIEIHDTIYKVVTRTEVSDNSDKAILDLQERNKDLVRQLEELRSQPIVARVDTVYQIKVVKEKEVDEAQLAKLEKEKRELELKLAQQKIEKEKAAILAANQKAKDEAARKEAERLRLEAERIAAAQRKKDAEKEDPIKTTEPVIPANKNYYVITMSSPNISTATKWRTKMLADFPDAKILPQPNGYYRVGVYVGKDKQTGLQILEQVKQNGYNPAWLSVE